MGAERREEEASARRTRGLSPMNDPECCEQPMWLSCAEEIDERGGAFGEGDGLAWECMACGALEVLLRSEPQPR